MADNVTLNAASGTFVAGSDDIAGVQIQYVKLMDGTLDSTEKIGGDAANGLDVDVTRLPSLPAGTNNIGDVDVLTMPATVAEDAASAGGETSVLIAAVRNDAAASTTTADGDFTNLAADAAGRVGIADLGGSITVDQATGTNLHTVVDSGTITTITNVVHTDDNGASLTVDAPVGTPVFVRLSDGAAPITALPITDNAGSLTVDGTVTAAQATAANLNATVVGTGTFAVQDSEKVADNAAFTDGTTKVQPVGFILDETAGTALTENDAAAARIDSKRAQVLVIEDATTRGQRAVVSAAGRVSVDASGVAVPVTDNSGSITVDAPVGTPVFVTITPSTTGGWSKWSTPNNGTGNAPLTNAVQTIKSGAGTFGGYMVYNPNATVAYLQVFDSTTASLGTTKAAIIIPIPPTSAANLEIANGVNMTTGIQAAATTTATGSTALATAGLDLTIWYK